MWPQPLILPMAALVFGAGFVASRVQAGQPQAMPEVLIPIRMPGDPAILLPTQAAGSGLPLTWEVATGPATVSGNAVTLTGELGPVRTPAGTRWRSISAGGGYLPLAVSEGGGLWIWDKSFLGSIPKPNREAGDPVRLGTDNDWRTIAAGRIGRIGINSTVL